MIIIHELIAPSKLVSSSTAYPTQIEQPKRDPEIKFKSRLGKRTRSEATPPRDAAQRQLSAIQAILNPRPVASGTRSRSTSGGVSSNGGVKKRRAAPAENASGGAAKVGLLTPILRVYGLAWNSVSFAAIKLKYCVLKSIIVKARQ